MPAGILGVDHPVIAVENMDAAEITYRNLGFTIPPRGSHMEWGTGNWCIMFPDDYLELRGIADASRYTHHLDEFLAERGEGLMGLAFATADAEDSYRTAVDTGLKPTALKDLTRRFHLSTGDAFPKFRIVYLSESDAPGLLTSVICGHLTPELIRRQEWLTHPNAVVGVSSITVVVADPMACRGAYEKLFGADKVRAADGALQVDFPRGARLEILSPQAAAKRGVALPNGKLPYLPAMTLAVTDIARTKATLAANGVAFETADGGTAITVAPSSTCGVIMTFAARHV
ncbi:MAG: VOC family protein [Reyranellaceae bacterium]